MEMKILIHGRENMSNQISYHCCVAFLPLPFQSARFYLQKHNQYTTEVSMGMGDGEEANFMGKLGRLV